MRIHTMTATFGQLEGKTLCLEPGLNVITAPNEWGKSTWCAFLLAMLYGIDTKQRAKAGMLPDKERYKPWSGKPMEGTITLNWQGREITIQRKSKGRIPMGEFRAFETSSGVPVPELTAENCGQQLLGVERSVYARSGFLRGGDLPVSQDENLQRRLNQLVTTGDDSDAGPELERRLRELRNKCQYNKSGLLPKARQALAEAQEKLARLESLEVQEKLLERDLTQAQRNQAALQNHLVSLQARENQEKRRRVDAAREREKAALSELARAEENCQGKPTLEQAQRAMQQLTQLREAQRSLELEMAMDRATPTPPQTIAPFQGLTGEQAQRKAQADQRTLAGQERTWKAWLFFALGVVLLAAGAVLLALRSAGYAAGALLLAGGAMAAGVWMTIRQRRLRQRRQELVAKYGTEDFLAQAADYAAAWAEYQRKTEQNRDNLEQYRQRQEEIRRAKSELLGREEENAFCERMAEAAACRAAWEQAQREAVQAGQRRRELEEVTGDLRSVEAAEDHMTQTREETQIGLERCQNALLQLRSQLDRCRGQRSELGQREQLEDLCARQTDRVARLEQYYAALGYALAALEEAKQQLQRRFAPQIASQAREILAQLTSGRYDRLLLETDLTVTTGAAGEDTLWPAIWRSDGTADQLYLALRLAVSRVLLPDCPLVLDDAMTRFDDARLRQAMELLRRESETRQVILFTCQNREANL